VGEYVSTPVSRGRDRALHLSESHGGVAVGGRERDDAPVVREPPERRLLDDCDRVVQLREDVPEHDQIELVGVVVTAFAPPSIPKKDSAVSSWIVGRKFRPVSSSIRSSTSAAALGSTAW